MFISYIDIHFPQVLHGFKQDEKILGHVVHKNVFFYKTLIEKKKSIPSLFIPTQSSDGDFFFFYVQTAETFHWTKRLLMCDFKSKINFIPLYNRTQMKTGSIHCNLTFF